MTGSRYAVKAPRTRQSDAGDGNDHERGGRFRSLSALMESFPGIPMLIIADTPRRPPYPAVRGTWAP